MLVNLTLAMVKSTILKHYNEERFEIPIEDELGEETTYHGTLAIRFRLATESDHPEKPGKILLFDLSIN